MEQSSPTAKDPEMARDNLMSMFGLFVDGFVLAVVAGKGELYSWFGSIILMFVVASVGLCVYGLTANRNPS